MIFSRPSKGTSGHISHGIHAVLLKLLRVPMPHPPEICNGLMGPQNPAVTFLRQVRNAHPVLIRRNVLCYNVHGNLAQIQVTPNPRCRRNARRRMNVPDYLPCQLTRRHPISGQVMGDIHHNLVDRVYMAVLRRHIF